MTLQEERDALQKRMDEIDAEIAGFVPGHYFMWTSEETKPSFMHIADHETYIRCENTWEHVEPFHLVAHKFLPEGWKVVPPEAGTLYDWSQAPEWANWAATDKDGRVWWYKTEPRASHEKWLGENSYIESTLPSPSVPWDHSLEQRPGITQ